MARGASARQDRPAPDPARPPERGSGALEPAAAPLTEAAKARPRRLKLAELFRLMADSAPTMVWVADPREKCTYVNRPWLTFTGRAFKEELGSGWQKPIHVGDRPAVAAAVHAAFLERRDFEIEFRLRRNDGEYRDVVTKGSPIRGPGDLFLGYVGSCVDWRWPRPIRHDSATMRAIGEVTTIHSPSSLPAGFASRSTESGTTHERRRPIRSTGLALA